MRIRNCIAACVATLFLTIAAAQSSLAASGCATGGRTYWRAQPFFWAPFVLVGD